MNKLHVHMIQIFMDLYFILHGVAIYHLKVRMKEVHRMKENFHEPMVYHQHDNTDLV